MFEVDPVAAARAADDAAASRQVTALVRAHALAISALGSAVSGAPRALIVARTRLARAKRLHPRSAETLGRIAHAAGYIAYKEGVQDDALAALNRAAELLAPHPARQAQVFDTLGAFFRAHGDLERAREYLLLSLRRKNESAGEGRTASVALTYGSLGRLALSLERYEEAEEWFRKDLKLLRRIGNASPVPRIEAQLAAALIGRGGSALREARSLLEGVLQAARQDSALCAYAYKDLARVEFAEGNARATLGRLELAQRLAGNRAHTAVRLQVLLMRGVVLASRAGRRPSEAKRGLRDFAIALSGFLRLGLYQEACEALLARAALHVRLRDEIAATADLEAALVLAEQHLFGQRQPLARIEERLSAHSPDAWARTRLRRMLGGVPASEHSGRLGARRRTVSVWTCDIRGFTRYVEETADPLAVVRMLDRFFEGVGSRILDGGGRIDKYVGDNVLAYFDSPEAACSAALESLEAMKRLNVERHHLGEPPLNIGVGISTGEVVLGNVGFAGKIEHTIIGSAVNTACRLVGVAESGEILLDDSTRKALRSGWLIRPKARVALKGLGAVRLHSLSGRRRPS